MEEILLARVAIMEHTKEQLSVSGVIYCPICKCFNSLNFAVQSNGHVHNFVNLLQSVILMVA